MTGLNFLPGKASLKACLGLMMALPFCRFARAQQPGAPIGELFAGDGNAQVVQPAGAGMSVVPGSELSAGIAPARLRLYRGGQVRICPRSSLTVNSGPFGLMFALGSGAIEIDYTLPLRASEGQGGPEVEHRSDFLLTPDFSIHLAAPGKYHFALASNKQGDTCVRTLPGNSAAIEVSEVLSSASYRIPPQESILFHNGGLNGSTPLQAGEACGCPEAPAVVQIAAGPPIKPQEQRPQPEAAPITASTDTATPPVPQNHSGPVHAQVEAPFVFSGKDAAGPRPYSVARLNFSSLPNLYFVQETVDPVVLVEKPVVSVHDQDPLPVAATLDKKPSQKKEKKGFFGKLKGFFSGLFHR